MHEEIIPAREQRWAGRFVRATMFRRRTARDWPVPEHLDHERIRFTGNNGADLDGIHLPVPNAKGIVVLAHPDRRYGKHWFIRQGWIEWLHDNGYAAFVFDFVQYGQSKGGSTYLYQDLICATQQARKLAPGQPIHVIGLSVGAFATAVAAPYLRHVTSISLESPYPDFTAWYQHAEGDTAKSYGSRLGDLAMRTFERVFPATSNIIRADRQINNAHPDIQRILITATRNDEVTPVHLTQRVAAHAPPERTEYIETDQAQHLGFFETEPEYRDAILRTLSRSAPGTSRRSTKKTSVKILA